LRNTEYSDVVAQMNRRFCFGPAETDVGHGFGNHDLAEERTVARIAMDAVGGRQPQVAVRIDAKPVVHACRTRRQHFAAGKRAAVGRYLEAAHMMRPIRLVRETGVDDIKQ
jgi:hypothetical protein